MTLVHVQDGQVMYERRSSKKLPPVDWLPKYSSWLVRDSGDGWRLTSLGARYYPEGVGSSDQSLLQYWRECGLAGET